MKRGEVYWADLSGYEGHEQGKKRPVLIIQNDIGNKNSCMTIIAPITTQSRDFVTHVYCRKQSLDYRSQVLLEQIRAIDKRRIESYVCTLNPDVMAEVDEKIKISLALNKEERVAGMTGLVKIGRKTISAKEYKGKRIVTFKDIDAVHERPDGTAKKRFSYNKDHFIEGVDFFKITPSEFRTVIGDMDLRQQNDVTLVTESGYLMLVKSFTDDLAWMVQRQLVDSYFRANRRMTPEEMMRVQLGMIDCHEERISKLENTMNIDSGQQRVLEKEVAAVVIESLGGKESNAYHEIAKKVFSECNRDVKDYFHVNSRNNIPRLRFDDAVDYIRNWIPCSNTRMRIKECNAQMSIS